MGKCAQFLHNRKVVWHGGMVVGGCRIFPRWKHTRHGRRGVVAVLLFLPLPLYIDIIIDERISIE